MATQQDVQGASSAREGTLLGLIITALDHQVRTLVSTAAGFHIDPALLQKLLALAQLLIDFVNRRQQAQGIRETATP